jgi:hypothetical protein
VHLNYLESCRLGRYIQKFFEIKQSNLEFKFIVDFIDSI